jgi:cytochrome c oxidase subunit 4
MTDVVEPGTEVVPSDAHGGELVRSDAEHPVAAEGHAHPGPRQYVLIAVVLVVLTALEVGASYLEGDVGDNLLITVLGVMAAAKFFLVAAWYMHMRQDAPFFRRMFLVGMIGATIVYGAVMLTFASTVLKS